MPNSKLLFLILMPLTLACTDKSPTTFNPEDYSGWETYAGTKDGMRYSSADQINLKNVSQLTVAWTFSTNDKDNNNRSQIQCNPIVVNGILYGTSPRLKLFALDCVTGELKWLFDPAKEDSSSVKDPMAFYKVSRGVVYWQDEWEKEKRIFYSAGAKTFSINAATGIPDRTFGKSGYIDLAENLDWQGDHTPFIANTTPGVIYKDLLIMGMRVAESADAAPGHIRAFDVRTGKRRWIFHTIPHPGEKGYETWPDSTAWKKLGGANNWAGMSLDEKRGIVYVPTGSVSGDFYGGFRKGQNLFANSLIALEASTGKYLWHYQVVHHDLWDMDLPANPNLVTVTHNGKSIDAVAQITKHGYVFLFDRVTGVPLFPIDEKSVPQQALPGEEPWPTQPIPRLPESFARQNFTEADVTDIDSATHQEMLTKFRQIKYSTMFTPPSKEGSWIFPGFDGGGEWGGAAVDPESQILYVNSSELPWSMVMIEIPTSKQGETTVKEFGKSAYIKYCVACHGPELKGNGPSFPSLVDLKMKYSEQEAASIIDKGRNMMPAFTQILPIEREALLAFLYEREPRILNHVVEKETKFKEQTVGDRIPYTMTGYNRFLDTNGYPGIKPPWGTLNAVDLNSGKLLWKVPLGEYKELSDRGIPITGTENYGGPLVTKGGLVFIAATKDAKIRAFDKNTGKIVWEASLPVPGYATPATYSVNGKQFIVIACGGGKIGSPSGDQYITFAIP